MGKGSCSGGITFFLLSYGDDGNGNCDVLPAVPSEGVIARLCASGLIQSRNLLESLRATRGVFAQGRHNLGELPKEWENGRQALINLSSQLEAMQMSIARHCQDSLGMHASRPPTLTCRIWLQASLWPSHTVCTPVFNVSVGHLSLCLSVHVCVAANVGMCRGHLPCVGMVCDLCLSHALLVDVPPAKKLPNNSTV